MYRLQTHLYHNKSFPPDTAPVSLGAAASSESDSVQISSANRLLDSFPVILLMYVVCSVLRRIMHGRVKHYYWIAW